MTVCRIIRTGNLQTGWALECNRQLIRTHPSAAVLGAHIDTILAGVNEYDADDIAKAIERLVAAKLAEMRDGRPTITPMGRKAVVRGSPSLWDTSG